MKTLILKKSELDKLSGDAQKEVLAIFKENENTIKSLKERIENLNCQKIDYRYDIDEGDYSLNENVFFDIWRKTSGEQWGNCSGKKFEFRLGYKYINCYIEGYGTDMHGWTETIGISVSKMSEIIDLLEEIKKGKSNVDTDRLIGIVSQRVRDLN